MKYLSLPVKLLQFWYPQSFTVWVRIWRNAILYLEEDLAVGLMWKLLFVPLFHDSTFTGKLLSFFFRLSRIFAGLLSFALVTTTIFVLAIIWFLLPASFIFLRGNWALIPLGLLIFGLILFLKHVFTHPIKKVGQIKDPGQIWQCTFVKKGDVDWAKLLKTRQVKELLSYLEQTPENLTGLNITITQEEILPKVLELGKKLATVYLGPQHFFVAALSLAPNIENQLSKLNLRLELFTEALDFFQRKEQFYLWPNLWDDDFHIKHLKGVNRGWLGVPTPTLDVVAEDLTRQAAKQRIPDFVGRQNVVTQVINTLSLEKGQNVILVGEPGAGKSALLAYLAKLIVSGDAPPSFATKRLIELSLTRLLTGITNQGELAERIKNIFDEVSFSGNIIVFVDEIQNLGIGEANSQFNLYSLMLPYIESSNFQFIASTEPGNFTHILEKNGAFTRLFTKIELPPASVAETLEILKNQAVDLEGYKKIKTSIIALEDLVKLTSEYIHDRVLPDAALHTYEQCQAVVENGWIKKSTVEKVLQTQVNVPIGEVDEMKKKQLLDLEEVIHQKMIDQVEAVSAVAKVLRRAAAQLRDKNRPIGSFLFVGPTGVGKTELAKTLAQSYFQGQGNFFRLDMSEYQTLDSINRLIGDSNNDGILTETVRLKPYTLILLDEFEKADPKILTLFLQVLDDGRLTSSTGRTIDFTNTIIIATSNAASLTIAQGIQSGLNIEQLNEKVKGELLQIFKPELVNRFDEVVLFKPLSPEDLQQVVKLKLVSLQDQLKDQGFTVEFDGGLIQKLAQRGYDPVLGARPLRRLIQDTLEARLSVMILENKLPKGEKFIASEQLLAD
ncbi:MAG: ATP-dependent Clp protease ATP-binding subunit [Patescibacteria group bacterium]|nr:ATP-dependent Clp protease ATP-binding subunit [Patescibacteria group bacterium]